METERDSSGKETGIDEGRDGVQHPVRSMSKDGSHSIERFPKLRWILKGSKGQMRRSWRLLPGIVSDECLLPRTLSLVARELQDLTAD